ncbi:MAG: argininosuccinate lyase [Candidatus Omnitrophota bacterium]
MPKKLWGGRFTKKINPLVEEFTKSIQYDFKIAQADIIGSLIHIQILKKNGYLTAEETLELQAALGEIFESIEKGKFKLDIACEDIHTQIQNMLEKKIGDLALKLHTARSRNDQVVFATKLYCKANISEIQDNINALIGSFEKIAGGTDIIIPGLTHMQHAQPIYLKDYFLAFVEMLKRDHVRLGQILGNIKITLGAGALAGTPIDAALYNEGVSEHLKTQKKNLTDIFKVESTVNSVDAVSDRDFVIEILSALSILGMHLSRLSEDLIIWSSAEFDFVEIDESFCTGSSLMPQKKNPDALELIRGYAGRLYGNLVSVLTTMKGLPLTYNRDMQLDKEPLFNSIEIASDELKILTGLIATLKFNKGKIEAQLKDESLYATDLVYYLVDKRIAFKEAHTLVGKLIKYSLDNDIRIKDMPEELLKKFSGKFIKKEIVKLFDPKVSVESKKSIKRK